MSEFELQLSHLSSIYSGSDPSFEEACAIIEPVAIQIRRKFSRLSNYLEKKIVPILNDVNKFLVGGTGHVLWGFDSHDIAEFRERVVLSPEQRMDKLEEKIYEFYPKKYDDSYLVGKPEELKPFLENLKVFKIMTWGSGGYRASYPHTTEYELRIQASERELMGVILVDVFGPHLEGGTFHIDADNIDSIQKAIMKVIRNPEFVRTPCGGGANAEENYK